MKLLNEKYFQNYINGRLQAPVSDSYIDNYQPATGKVYTYIPDSDGADVEQAVKAAEAAFPLWSNIGHGERSRILLKISDLIKDNLDELALAESEDNGKPFSLAKSVDIPRAASNFRFFCHGNRAFCFAVALYGTNGY